MSNDYEWEEAFDTYCHASIEHVEAADRAHMALIQLAKRVKVGWHRDLLVTKLARTEWTKRNWLREAFNLTDEDIQACIERETRLTLECRLEKLHAMPYREYLSTPEWQERRKRILARDSYHCQVCFSTEYLNVHHRTYERRGNEDDSDLITLCRDCHYIFHENGRLAEVDG
jgi:hypothetical protein